MTTPSNPSDLPVPATPTRAGYAVAALVLGVFAIFARIAGAGIGLTFGLAATACAFTALRQINRGQATGRGMAVWGLILGLFITLSGLGGLAPDSASSPASAAGGLTPSGPSAIDSTPSRPAAPTTISATTMGDDFERNQPAAEKKWGGQYVQFTAPVGNITSSGVTFTDVTSQFSFTQISCVVSDENSVLTLAKGAPATVRGVVSDDQVLGIITLNRCEIVGRH
jgi:hypothetical protein